MKAEFHYYSWTVESTGDSICNANVTVGQWNPQNVQID